MLVLLSFQNFRIWEKVRSIDKNHKSLVIKFISTLTLLWTNEIFNLWNIIRYYSVRICLSLSPWQNFNLSRMWSTSSVQQQLWSHSDQPVLPLDCENVECNVKSDLRSRWSRRSGVFGVRCGYIKLIAYIRFSVGTRGLVMVGHQVGSNLLLSHYLSYHLIDAASSHCGTWGSS